MTLPAYAQVSDPLDGPAGTLTTPNWASPADGRAAGLTIPAGGGATAPVDGTLSASAWSPELAVCGTAFVQLGTLPSATAGRVVRVGCIRRVNGDGVGTDAVYCTYKRDTSQLLLTVDSPGGATLTVNAFTPSAGDWIGFDYTPADTIDDLARLWYRPAAAAAWIFKGSIDGAQPLDFTLGWFGFLETNDATVRLRNFGIETLASVTPPVVHGRGAC